MTARMDVREMGASDLAAVQAWLAPGMDRELPASDAAERWLLATRADRPLACLRLRRAIGLDSPRHWYHVGCVVHAAAELGLVHRLHTLQLGNDLTGASEIADVAWDRAALDLAAGAQALAQLLAAALQEVAARRDAHAPRLIVELPGLRDADGRSPFWQGLGRHFYDGDPVAAALRFGPAWRGHVAALLPRQPIYTDFLCPAAQAAVAQVDPAARVLLDLLWQAGLRYAHHVCIDDGGPVFECATDLVVAPGAGRAASVPARAAR
ncbi:putative Arginine N-succinyltransferase [Rubrivivax sp. A210]|uniref:arginine N-succinyltransferase n=1 Tax=Rubrivivax sp. A210 TaxID=2772301 RepID=UPI00191AE39E|nr:arginine N-succinyltransferase [Rubrivivax sp. A210]CAD5375146.1 putative Arginine N-succinyltransferase [Rubrivivax sp. A210]